MTSSSFYGRRAHGGNVSGDPMRSGRDRWLVSYADLVTLLLACFTTAYAAAQVAPETHTPAGTAPIPAIVEPVREEARPEPRPSLRDAIVPIVLAALGDTQVDVVEDRRGLVISLPESAAFDTGSAALTGDARTFLTRLADVLGPTDASVRIEGHTDDVPFAGTAYRSNWELSTARSSAVVQFLVSEAAFAPERLSAAGYGEFHPRVANDSPEHRALNRRVDVVVVEAESGSGR